MNSNNDFPDVLKVQHVMDNSDLCVVGKHLGHDWNDVCTAVGDAGIYAEDGEGAITMERQKDPSDYSEHPMIRAIFEAIFENYPQVDEIMIVN